MIAGLDEAGRGPVIGPMVVGIAYCHEEFLPKLRKIGVKDSKLLSDKERKELYDKVKGLVKTDYIIVDTKEIDEQVAMGRLNKLEMNKFAELINRNKVTTAIIDCPVKDTEKFVRQMKEKTKCEIIAENKADLNHAIVGAASIIAKEVRELEIKKLKEDIGIDFGSGYPSDPKTQEFIKKHWKDYEVFRKSWQTYKNIKENAGQKTLF